MNKTQRFLSGLAAASMMVTVAAATAPAASAAPAEGHVTADAQQTQSAQKDYSNTVGVRNDLKVPVTVHCHNSKTSSFTLKPGQKLWKHWRLLGQSHPKVLTFTTASGAELGTVTLTGRYVNAAGEQVSGAHLTWKAFQMKAKETTKTTRFVNPVTVLDVQVLPVREYLHHNDYPVDLVVSPGSHF